MELLAPCSSKETFFAALNAGADAIYLGGKQFSARAYAENFTIEDIKECIDIAHAVNVEVHITVNTLLFEEEFEECFKMCEEYIALGVDALIIQDLGLISKIHRCYPNFPIHASTQLNVHNVSEALMLKKLGVTRIVMARESSLEDIKEIIKKTHLEIEVFAHGALCVSCSGQCLMSSFIGNRSGNRGRCAQPCRLEGKIVTSEGKIISDNYPLSMKDLCTIENLPLFEQIGITSLKIEGRMKNQEYIYHTVKAYRDVLDGKKFDGEVEAKLKTAFNREYTKGFILNETGNKTLNQKTSSHIGLEIGKVTKITKNSFFLVLKEDLSLHDGLRDLTLAKGFLLTHFKFKGFDVHYAKKGSYIEIISPIKGIKINDIIVKTKSKVLEDETKIGINTLRKIPLNGYFFARENNFMSFTLSENDLSYTAYSMLNLEKSKNAFSIKEDLLLRLSKTDKYPFILENVDFDIEPGLFYPIKELNELRRNAYEGFYNLKIESAHQKNIKVNEKEINLKDNETINEIATIENENQLKVVLEYPFTYIFVPENLYTKYHEQDSRIHLHLKRMGKDNIEEKLSLAPYLSSCSSFLSPYGNITNHEALLTLLRNNYLGVILSYELNLDNALKLKNKFSEIYQIKPNLFYPIYGHIDYMLLKSCPIATGSKKEIKCGLCHKNKYFYVDRKDVKYPLLTTSDCYIKVLSPLPLSLISKKKIIKQNFIPYFNFTLENSEQVKNVLEAYFNDDIELYDYFEGHFYKSPE